MNFDELFTRAVALLPGPVRERLDGDFPLDWTVLEDAGTGSEVAAAVHARRRLPRPVEVLVHRLIRDIGIVPGDVAAGIERSGTASAWIHWITMEADGESYLLRNDRSGDVHCDIRPEAVAGYATLGLDLATMLHDAVERWIEAGGHHRTTSEGERDLLGQCAVRMHAHLRSQPETVSGHRSAASLARTLEYAWNTQSVESRAVLAGTRLSTARGACAPRRRYYAPVAGHRLHACDAGEIRWLRALAERAAAGTGAGDSARATQRPEAGARTRTGAGDTARATRRPAAGAGTGVSDTARAARRPAAGAETGVGDSVRATQLPAAGTGTGTGESARATQRSAAGTGAGESARATQRSAAGTGTGTGESARATQRSAAGTRTGAGDSARTIQRPAVGAGTGTGQSVRAMQRPPAAAGTNEVGQSTHEFRGAGERASAAHGGAPVDGGDGDRGASESGTDRDGAATDVLQLGTDPEDLNPESEVGELGRIANRLADPIRRRLGDDFGARAVEAVDRLCNARELDALRATLRSAAQGQAVASPPWLQELAAALLMDTGARTREGLRTASMRLEPGRQSDGRYRATEVETGAVGHFGPNGLVEQIRLGLAYAQDAWTGLAALRSAGKEGEWALTEGQAGTGRLSAGERDTLEAARHVGQALARIQRARAPARGDRSPGALDQAAMTAEALKSVGPSVRTVTGWPGAAPAPDPRKSDDVARIVTVAEGLHAEIRAIANRLIAGWVAEAQAHGDDRKS